MLTDIAKMATGLVVRGGLGLPLRIAAFAAMTWGAWHAWLAYGVPYLAWADENDAEILVVLPVIPVLVGTILALAYGVEGSGRHWGHARAPWRPLDFLCRAPFAAWCIITDDGRDVPLWSILSWPGVAVVDFVLAAGTLVAMPCWGLWLAAGACGRAAWRVLNIRPLDRGR